MIINIIIVQIIEQNYIPKENTHWVYFTSLENYYCYLKLKEIYFHLILGLNYRLIH